MSPPTDCGDDPGGIAMASSSQGGQQPRATSLAATPMPPDQDRRPITRTNIISLVEGYIRRRKLRAAAHHNALQQRQHLTFMSLPAEVRMMIYQYLLSIIVKDVPDNVLFNIRLTYRYNVLCGWISIPLRHQVDRPLLTPAILQVCRLINSEATEVLYRENVFKANIETIDRLLVEQPRFDFIRMLTISIWSFTPYTQLPKGLQVLYLTEHFDTESFIDYRTYLTIGMEPMPARRLMLNRFYNLKRMGLKHVSLQSGRYGLMETIWRDVQFRAFIEYSVFGNRTPSEKPMPYYINRDEEPDSWPLMMESADDHYVREQRKTEFKKEKTKKAQSLALVKTH